MALPQAFARHELFPKELQTHRISTTTPHSVNLGSGEYSNTPELLVAVAWSIAAARWFYSSEVNFRVVIDRVHSIVPVQASVGPEVRVDDFLQQLKSQMSLGDPSGTSSSEKDLSRKFCIVYETGKAYNTIRCTRADNRYVEAAKSRNNSVIMFDCDARGPDLQMTISFSENFLLDNAERVGRTVQVLLQQLVSPGAGDMMLTDLDVISETDLVETWETNATVPPGVKTPVHRLIQQQATERPEATAVCSRDGSLTYKELDGLATRVASGLIRMGVKQNTVVPLYFEKSRWMPVALMGVLKAGGVFLQLAKSIPKGRTEAILSVDKPPFALIGTASTTPDWLSQIVSTVTVHELLAQHDENSSCPLSESSPGQDAVRLFTSGSTGQPKIIAWSHEALATNCQCIKDCLSLGPETRHFQTASYEFDVSMMETVAVFMAGGCLCLSLEEEGTNCSPRAVAELQGNSAYLTPTIAGGLDPDSVPTLRQLALEGEIVPKDVVSKWAGKVTLYNFYGPAECPLAATCVINPESFRTGFAGKASCSLRWVVDPHDQDKLLPSGAIGELLIEGPILMDRYLGVSALANPFVTPTWLQRGFPGFPGRQGRLYKTGDLVQCDRDGNIVVLGRKDTQVQICAERVELSEVEHHVRKYLTDSSVGVVAEMITPAGHSKPILAAFLGIGEKAALPTGERRGVLETLTSGLGVLEEHVPQTFIPAAYIAVDKVPLTAAGKMNRRALRELGASMTLDQIAQLHVSRLGVEPMLKN